MISMPYVQLPLNSALLIQGCLIQDCSQYCQSCTDLQLYYLQGHLDPLVGLREYLQARHHLLLPHKLFHIVFSFLVTWLNSRQDQMCVIVLQIVDHDGNKLWIDAIRRLQLK